MNSQPLSTVAPVRLRTSSLSLGLTFVMLAAVPAAVAFVPYIEFIGLMAVLIGSFIAYMRLRPDSQDGHLFELIIPVTLLNVLYFVVGTMYLVIVPEGLQFPALRPYLLPANALAVLGALCFLVGYGWFCRATPPSPWGRFAPKTVWVSVAPALLGTLGMAANRFQLESFLKDRGISVGVSFLQQFGFLFYFGWFLAWYMIWAGRWRPAVAVPLLAVLSGMGAVVLYFNFGSKALAVALLFMPAIAYYEVKRRLPVKSIAVVVLIFVFVIFPMFNTYRAQNRSLDMGSRLDKTMGVATTWNGSQFMDASLFAFFSRLAVVTSVAAIISDTGRWVDYKYGETLILAPIGLFVPRFIWPSKPNISIGKEFGATFRIASEMDRITEVAPTMVGEFYWNFSLPGAILGMWLLGIGYRWLYQRFGAGSGFDPIRKSIYVTMLPSLLLIEDNVAIITAGVAKALVLIVLFLFLARWIGWLEDAATA